MPPPGTDTSVTANKSLAARGTPLSPSAFPLVSVVIPVRNDAKRLAVCLESLAKQNYPGSRYEVIVIDNGSTDQSCEVAKRAGATVAVFPGLRVGALRNRGVDLADGEILAFVDSDHEVPENWIKAAVEQLSVHADIVMIGSPCLAPSKGTWVQRIWELHRLRNRATREVAWLGAGNLFMRRSAFISLGGFDENLVAAEDVDLCVRVAKHSGQILSDMVVANVHYGEPATLWLFFKKEYWRGSSGIRAFFSHGMPLHELPSLIWPAYHLLALGAGLAAIVLTAVTLSPVYITIAAGVLVLPSLLLATSTALKVRRTTAIPALTILYFVYAISRAAALFKR